MESMRKMYRFFLRSHGCVTLSGFGRSCLRAALAQRTRQDCGPGRPVKAAGEIATTGSARVIVTLEMPFAPKAHLASQRLPRASRPDQESPGCPSRRNGFACSRTHGTQVHPCSSTRHDRQSAAALQALLASPLVRSVEEDVPVPVNLDLSVPRIGRHRFGPQGTRVKGLPSRLSTRGLTRIILFSAARRFQKPAIRRAPRVLALPSVPVVSPIQQRLAPRYRTRVAARWGRATTGPTWRGLQPGKRASPVPPGLALHRWQASLPFRSSRASTVSLPPVAHLPCLSSFFPIRSSDWNGSTRCVPATTSPLSI